MDFTEQFLQACGFYDDSQKMEELKQLVRDHYNNIVPGYEFNYLHYKLDGFIEFYYCYQRSDPDRKCFGLDVHFSADRHLKFSCLSPIEPSLTAPYYRMRINGSASSYPVRVICPDILPEICDNENIYGQVVFFAEQIEQLDNIPDGGSYMKPTGQNTISCNGIITESDDWFAYLLGTDIYYYEYDVSTAVGNITVLIPLSVCPEKLAEGSCISCTGVLSVDVTSEPNNSQSRLYRNRHYDQFIPEAVDEYYGDGFILNEKYNAKILGESILSDNYTRFDRCCYKVVEIKRNNETVLIGNCASVFNELCKVFLSIR